MAAHGDFEERVEDLDDVPETESGTELEEEREMERMILQALLKATSELQPGESIHSSDFLGALNQTNLDEMLLSMAYMQSILEDRETPEVGAAIKVVDILLASGANINYKNHQGTSVLLYAVEGQEVEMVKHLLAKDAYLDPEVFNSEFLDDLIDNWEEPMFELLVDHGVPPSESSVALAQALYLCVGDGDIERVKYYAEHGVNLTTTMGLAPFFDTVFLYLREEKMLNKLLSDPAYYQIDKVGNDQLQDLLNNLSQSMEVVKFLLPHGFPVIPADAIRTMAQSGCFVTMAKLYFELISAGKCIEFPVDDVDFETRCRDTPMAVCGARALRELIRRSRGQVKSPHAFLQTLDCLVDGGFSVDCDRVPKLRHLLAEQLRKQILGQKKDLKEVLASLPVPASLVSYIIMDDVLLRLHGDIMKMA